MHIKLPCSAHMVRRYRFDTLAAAKSAGPAAIADAGTVKLSVIVPCYNVASFVSDTCHSIVANSCHLDIEVILVDDGSQDDSANIAEKVLVAGGVLTSVVTIPNSGLSAARNVGLCFASAPYVAFLDADDLMAPDAYSHLWRLAYSEQCDQTFARSSAFDDARYNDFEFFDTDVWNNILSGLAVRVFRPSSEPLVFLTEPKTCTRIWRTDFLRDHGLKFPEGRLFEDIGFHLRALALSEKIGVVDVQGLVYRVGRAGALTLDKSRKRLDVVANISEALAAPELQDLPSEAGAFTLLSIMRITRWCRTMVDLRMKKEFDHALANCYAQVPRTWIDALYRIDSREADRFVAAAAAGRGIRPALTSGSIWLYKRILKKRRWAMPGWKHFGTDTPAAETAPTRRYHFSEIRSHGPGLAMLAPDATLAFLSSCTRVNALRIARTRPRATIFAVDGVADLISEEMKKQRNIQLFSTAAELVAELRAKGVDLGLVDMGSDASFQSLAAIQELKTDFLAGAFDPLAVQNTPSFLVAAREQVRRGYFLWRHDGQRYSYVRSCGGPAVSVVVPVYNVLPYLDQCIETLSAQTLADREIILVDDGATDGSAARCDEWAAKDPTIRVIHKVNGGCASARMAGLAAARGEYVTFVDGDDWIDPSMFERLLHLGLRTGDDVVEAGWCFAFPSGSIDDRTQVERETCYVGVGGVMRRPRDAAMIGQPTIWRRLYRRSFLQDQQIGFDVRLRRFDDMPFQFETLAKSGDLAYEDNCMVYYRQGREGQDIGVTDKRLMVHFPITSLLRETALASGSKDMFKKFLMIQYHTHMWALTKIEPELKKTYQDFVARDLFGPEQYGGSLSNLNRLMRLFPRYRSRILSLYFRYVFYARRLDLPGIADVK